MQEMVKDIRGEFNTILSEIDWMDEETRIRAKDKLKTMKEYIGYPEEIMVEKNLEDLYVKLEVGSESHFLNGINMSVWGTNYAWAKLREVVDKTDWKRHGAPAVVNAFYSSIENSIQFPAGILQGNFFGSDRPAYMNYGGIGWVIGHEITHGFDDQGRQYDDKGNLKNWWKDQTKDKFLDKSQCIIWQYGNYTAKSVNKSLNGVNTQGRILQIMEVSRKPTEHTPVGLEDMERRTDCQDYSRILPIRCSGSVQPTPGAPSTGTKHWRRGSRLGFTLQVCSGFRDRSPTVESLQMTSTVLSGQE